MNYESFFNLKEKPFSLTPDTNYYFSSESHKEAMRHLLYCIRSDDGFIELSGNPGTGKTLTIRSLLKQIAGENITVSYIINSKADPQDLLNTIAIDLGMEPDTLAQHSGEQLLRLFHQHLINNNDENITSVVIIDEAQNLSPQALEQLCLLSNLETEKKKLLKIILVGQLAFDKNLNRPEFQKIYNRITIRYQLNPMTINEIDAYIQYRIRIASQSGTQMAIPPFPKMIIHQVYRYSKGNPRLVNCICDRTLMAAFIDNKRDISTIHLKKALRSLLSEKVIQRNSRQKVFARIALLSIVLLTLVYLMMLIAPDTPTETPPEQITSIIATEKQTGVVQPEIPKAASEPSPQLSNAIPKVLQESIPSVSQTAIPTITSLPESVVFIFSPDDNRMVVWKGQMNLSFVNKPNPSMLTEINSGAYFLEKDFSIQQGGQETEKSLPLKVTEPDQVSATIIKELLAEEFMLDISEISDIEQPDTDNSPSPPEKLIALPDKSTIRKPAEKKKPRAIVPRKKKQSLPETQKTVPSEKDSKKKDTNDQFPQHMVSVQAGVKVAVISPDINRLFVWKGSSTHPQFVHQEDLESSLKEGIYILGKENQNLPYMFHPEHSFSIPRQLIDKLWEILGKQSSNTVIPVLVLSSGKVISPKHLEKGKKIESIVHQWVDAWQLKDSEKLMRLFNPKYILFYNKQKPPIALAWEVLKNSQASIFSKNTRRMITTSKHVCLLDPNNPDTAVAIFNQMHFDSNYSESGVKVFFMKKTNAPEAKSGWIINGRLWIQGAKILEDVP